MQYLYKTNLLDHFHEPVDIHSSHLEILYMHYDDSYIAVNDQLKITKCQPALLFRCKHDVFSTEWFVAPIFSKLQKNNC